jgi:hypothetical protein
MIGNFRTGSEATWNSEKPQLQNKTFRTIPNLSTLEHGQDNTDVKKFALFTYIF